MSAPSPARPPARPHCHEPSCVGNNTFLNLQSRPQQLEICLLLSGKSKQVPSLPGEQDGTYWGYPVRMASSIKAIFDEAPFPGGYDLKIGTSERGNVTVDDERFESSRRVLSSLLPSSRHLVFSSLVRASPSAPGVSLLIVDTTCLPYDGAALFPLQECCDYRLVTLLHYYQLRVVLLM